MPHRSLLAYLLVLAAPAAKAIPHSGRLFASRQGQALRHWFATHVERRRSVPFTQFLRLPSQLDALSGPVLAHLGAAPGGLPLRIAVFGCSIGAEPYTISSVLRTRRPDLDVIIDAYDIDPAVLETARRGAYSLRQVFGNAFMTADFAAATFEAEGESLVVRPEIAARVRFHRCDLLDPGFAVAVPSADIVCAQNVLLNMQRADARRAFDHVASIVRAPGALLVDGMDLDMRASRTRAHGLVPLGVNVERIHREARVLRGSLYPWHAAGLEPYDAAGSDPARRYSTIFLRAPPTPVS